jgi:hypothetical protein
MRGALVSEALALRRGREEEVDERRARGAATGRIARARARGSGARFFFLVAPP